MSRQVAKLALAVAAVVVALGACASGPDPRDQLTTALSNVRAAETAGAKNHPQAELALKRATDRIAEGKKAIKEELNVKAQRLLEKAAIDAELAMVLAQAAEENKKANSAIKRVKRLQGN